MKIETALQILGLDQRATMADVKSAYRDLVKIWHPDRFQNDERLSARTEIELKRINEARKVALAYLERYGHFQHVGRAKQKPQGAERSRQQTSPPKKEDQKSEAPPPEEPATQTKSSRPTLPRISFPLRRIAVWGLGSALLLLISLNASRLVLESLETPQEKHDRLMEQRANASAQLREEYRRHQESLKPNQKAETAEKTMSRPPTNSKVDTFFTLGSTKEWVASIQGPPQRIIGDEWLYGESTIQFYEDTVVGWQDSDLNPLTIGMIKDPQRIYSRHYFTVGTHKRDVVLLQGAPSAILGDDWYFDEALVQFNADTVIFFKNDGRHTLHAL